MKLYNYWRSSSSWRVRIALSVKGIPYQYVAVNLLKGEQQQPAHLARNPAAALPVLELDDGTMLTQSVAICEYLEEAFPEHPLLPKAPAARAQVRAMAELINSGMQPYQNPPCGRYVREVANADDKAFTRHFLAAGLASLEILAAKHAGTYLHGDEITLADCFLVPQLFGARRFGVDLTPYPTLTRVEAVLNVLPAFIAASAEVQPDAASQA